MAPRPCNTNSNKMVPKAPLVEKNCLPSMASNKMMVNVVDTRSNDTSQTRLEPQKTRGLTPVIIWTCLALVILSTSGKSKNADAKRLNPRVSVKAYKNVSGLMKSFWVICSNLAVLSSGKGWLDTVMVFSAPNIFNRPL